jgi:hypothetical protein
MALGWMNYFGRKVSWDVHTWKEIDPCVYRANGPWHYFKLLSTRCAFQPRDLGRN